MKSEVNQALQRLLESDIPPEEMLIKLNAIADEELQKPDEEIDFALIDECTAAMLELQSSKEVDYDKILTTPSAESILQSVRKDARVPLRRIVKILLVAAIIFATTITANAAIGSFTGETLVDKIVVSFSGEEKQHKRHHKEETTTAPPQTTRISTTRKSTRKKRRYTVTTSRHSSGNYFNAGDAEIKIETTTEETTTEVPSETTTQTIIEPPKPEEDTTDISTTAETTSQASAP